MSPPHCFLYVEMFNCIRYFESKTNIHGLGKRLDTFWFAILFFVLRYKLKSGESYMPTGEIQPSALKIDKIINRISDGDIKVPAFQRGFVWNQDQVIELLDSIYRNYPVGSILLWSSTEQLRSTRNIAGLVLPERDPDYPVNYILDGQQRLSTVYATFATDREFDESDPVYRVNQNIFDLAFFFEDESFRPCDAASDGESIRLSCIFDTTSMFEALNTLTGPNQNKAKDMYSRFNNYEFPVVTITKREKAEVGAIFERINSTATVLSTLDLLVAWTWSDSFHLQEAINGLRDTLDQKGFADLPDKIILQCLAAVVEGSTKTKTILSLDPQNLQDSFPTVANAISATVDFLSTEFSVYSLDFLPHLQQVVGLTYLFSTIQSPDPEQLGTLRKWFWRTSFSRRYSGQTDDKMNADIEFMKQVTGGKTVQIRDYATDTDDALLLKQKFSKRNPYTRAILLLMATKGPKDLISGTKIDLTDALAGYNRKEYHHIFPRAHLKSLDTPADKINALCNFCFLPAGSNKKISDRKPSEYVFELISDETRKELMASNLMPVSMDIYQHDDYDAFLKKRADLMIQAIDELTN